MYNLFWKRFFVLDLSAIGEYDMRTLSLFRALGSVLAATLLLTSTPAFAQNTANFEGVTFGLQGGAGGYGALSAAYLFPVGNSGWLVGPVVGYSTFSSSQVATPKKVAKPAPKTSMLLDIALGNITTTVSAEWSLGVRAAKILPSERGLIFGEIGAEHYNVSTSKDIFSLN
jgi:hypothetical protein